MVQFKKRELQHLYELATSGYLIKSLFLDSYVDRKSTDVTGVSLSEMPVEI